MTNKRASEILYDQWQSFLEENLDYGGVSEAYKKAFKALEEQEPCEDAISRQVVLDILAQYEDSEDLAGVLIRIIKELPSVSTEKLDKAKSEIRCGENKAYNADFTMGCEYAISVIERIFEEVEE